MKDYDMSGAFEEARSAAKEDLDNFMLLKNLSGKINWIGILLFTVVMIIATGSFAVLVFSAVISVISTFSYYVSALNRHFQKDVARQRSKNNDDSSGVEHKDRC